LRAAELRKAEAERQAVLAQATESQAGAAAKKAQAQATAAESGAQVAQTTAETTAAQAKAADKATVRKVGMFGTPKVDPKTGKTVGKTWTDPSTGATHELTMGEIEQGFKKQATPSFETELPSGARVMRGPGGAASVAIEAEHPLQMVAKEVGPAVKKIGGKVLQTMAADRSTCMGKRSRCWYSKSHRCRCKKYQLVLECYLLYLQQLKNKQVENRDETAESKQSLEAMKAQAEKAAGYGAVTAPGSKNHLWVLFQSNQLKIKKRWQDARKKLNRLQEILLVAKHQHQSNFLKQWIGHNFIPLK
jgi:hypothetical protein